MSKTRINKEIEYKELTGKLKDVDVKSGIVTGYFAHFGNVDSYGDIIEKGAFTKTIAERGPNGTNQILHLLQHDTQKVLGKPYLLSEDNFGLYFESKIVPTGLGVDTLKLYEAGVYNEHSVGYKTIRYEYVESTNGDDDVFILKELKLYEGSTVAWGANEMTPFMGFKSESKQDAFQYLDTKMDAIFKAMRQNGLTDETHCQLEIQIAQIKSAYQNIDSLFKNASSSANDTRQIEKPNDELNRLNEANDKGLQQKQINELSNNLLKIFTK